MKTCIFICGVNGVGKSSVIPYLLNLLPKDRYDIHDFDERGVPESAGSSWRASETTHWLKFAQDTWNRTGQITIVCGFVKPADFGDAVKEIGSKIHCIFLDAQPEVIRTRLTQRYTKDGIFDPGQTVIGKSAQAFIEGNLFIRESLKQEFEQLGCAVIDTSNMMPEDVAKEIVRII